MVDIQAVPVILQLLHRLVRVLTPQLDLIPLRQPVRVQPPQLVRRVIPEVPHVPEDTLQAAGTLQPEDIQTQPPATGTVAEQAIVQATVQPIAATLIAAVQAAAIVAAEASQAADLQVAAATAEADVLPEGDSAVADPAEEDESDLLCGKRLIIIYSRPLSV